MQRLEVSVAVRPIYGSLGAERLTGLLNLVVWQICVDDTDQADASILRFLLNIQTALLYKQSVTNELRDVIKEDGLIQCVQLKSGPLTKP